MKWSSFRRSLELGMFKAVLAGAVAGLILLHWRFFAPWLVAHGSSAAFDLCVAIWTLLAFMVFWLAVILWSWK